MTDVPAASLSLDRLNKRFASVQAVADLSLDIAAGEFFFLLGPSGCGKTTLLRMLAGLEAPDSGTIRIGGADVGNSPPHRRGIPMVFQSYALWPHLTVAENVAFGLVERRLSRAEIRERTDAALAQVSLADCASRRPGQLSGGQQQRVALARALVLGTGVVLLDEPLSNLDAKLRHEMRAELRRLHAEHGMTFVYVTHDQSEALSMADRMGVMNAGRLCAVGTPRELYHRPPNAFTAAFLGEANLMDGRLTALGARHGTVETPFGAWRATVPAGRQFSAGDAVRLMVRPEALRPGMAEGANTLAAVTQALRMQGATVSVTLDAGGQTLSATIRNRFDLPLETGASASWNVDPDETIVLAPEAAL